MRSPLSRTVCARVLMHIGLMRLFYVGMVSPSIAAYPSEPEVWWHFHAQWTAAPPPSLEVSTGAIESGGPSPRDHPRSPLRRAARRRFLRCCAQSVREPVDSHRPR